MYILYMLKKTTLATENSSTVLHNLFVLNISTFNGLVIKNDPGRVSTASWPSLGNRRQKFSP